MKILAHKWITQPILDALERKKKNFEKGLYSSNTILGMRYVDDMRFTCPEIVINAFAKAKTIVEQFSV